MNSRPLVVDIYHGNEVASFERTKAFGIVGIIHKSSQATKMVDKAYATRRKMAQNAGLLWGAYHFMSVEDGKIQADHFLSAADPDKDTLLAIDWETDMGREPSAKIAREMLERIIEKLGRKAKIYSGNVAKEQIKGKDSFFGSHDLWLAQYGTRWSVQASWEKPWLWQNNGDDLGPGPHRIPGLAGLVDNSCIIEPMTRDDLIAQWAR